MGGGIAGSSSAARGTVSLRPVCVCEGGIVPLSFPPAVKRVRRTGGVPVLRAFPGPRACLSHPTDAGGKGKEAVSPEPLPPTTEADCQTDPVLPPPSRFNPRSESVPGQAIHRYDRPSLCPSCGAPLAATGHPTTPGRDGKDKGGNLGHAALLHHPRPSDVSGPGCVGAIWCCPSPSVHPPVAPIPARRSRH